MSILVGWLMVLVSFMVRLLGMKLMLMGLVKTRLLLMVMIVPVNIYLSLQILNICIVLV
jgi:hypothetical protein